VGALRVVGAAARVFRSVARNVPTRRRGPYNPGPLSDPTHSVMCTEESWTRDINSRTLEVFLRREFLRIGCALHRPTQAYFYLYFSRWPLPFNSGAPPMHLSLTEVFAHGDGGRVLPVSILLMLYQMFSYFSQMRLPIAPDYANPTVLLQIIPSYNSNRWGDGPHTSNFAHAAGPFKTLVADLRGLFAKVFKEYENCTGIDENGEPWEWTAFQYRQAHISTLLVPELAELSTLTRWETPAPASTPRARSRRRSPASARSSPANSCPPPMPKRRPPPPP